MKARPREVVFLAQSLRQALDEIAEHGRILGYGLIAMLAARATDLVAEITRNPGAAARSHAAAGGALGTMITAMKRVAQNGMEGDGGVAGLKLLEMVDGLIAPVRTGLR